MDTEVAYSRLGKQARCVARRLDFEIFLSQELPNIWLWYRKTSRWRSIPWYQVSRYRRKKHFLALYQCQSLKSYCFLNRRKKTRHHTSNSKSFWTPTRQVSSTESFSCHPAAAWVSSPYSALPRTPHYRTQYHQNSLHHRSAPFKRLCSTWCIFAFAQLGFASRSSFCQKFF